MNGEVVTWRNLRKENNTSNAAATRLQPRPAGSTQELGTLAPESCGTCERSDFSEPRLSIHSFPTPLATTSLFFMSVNLFLFCG